MDFNTAEVVEQMGSLSKINSAGLINSTMNNLWVDFFRHYRDGKYLTANSDLDCIWTILGGEKGMKESQEEKDYFEIETNLSKVGILRDSFEVKGFDSSAYQRDFDAQMNIAKANDQGSPTLSLAPRTANVLIGWENIPDANYGA